MKFIVFLLSIFVLIKNLSYANYEYKINKNISGCICIIFLNIVTFLFINTILFFMT